VPEKPASVPETTSTTTLPKATEVSSIWRLYRIALPPRSVPVKVRAGVVSAPKSVRSAVFRATVGVASVNVSPVSIHVL